jgi:hypothetical protein
MTSITSPIIRNLPIALVACLRCLFRHEWHVIAYKTGTRDVVSQDPDDGRYIPLEGVTLPGQPKDQPIPSQTGFKRAAIQGETRGQSPRNPTGMVNIPDFVCRR